MLAADTERPLVPSTVIHCKAYLTRHEPVGTLRVLKLHALQVLAEDMCQQPCAQLTLPKHTNNTLSLPATSTNMLAH